MPKRAFLITTIILSLIVFLTTPSVLRPFVPVKTAVPPTTTPLLPTTTPTATTTPDPFIAVPTATPFGFGSNNTNTQLLPTLPPPMLNPLHRAIPTINHPPPTPTQPLNPTAHHPTRILHPLAPNSQPLTPTPKSHILNPESRILNPAIIPEQLIIPALNLNVPIDPVGLIPSNISPGVFEWEVPNYKAAGWLNTSAPLGKAGNTVLDGHHNIAGEVFNNLWTLKPGDSISVKGKETERHYTVTEVLILPERNQPLETRLKNAKYIQPTADERLTLITCWPYNDNSHRAIVIAKATNSEH